MWSLVLPSAPTCVRNALADHETGNHDLSLDSGYRFKYEEGWTVQAKDVAKCRELLNASPTITYLEHAAVEVVIPGKNVLVRVFGSPHSPDRGGQNWAFQYTEREAEELWSAVPFDTDILISHTPPAGHCDASKHWLQGGCKGLLSRIQLIKPLLHVCGHCHEGRGGELLRWNADNSSELARQWEDPGQGNKKQSLFDVTILHPGSEAQCIPQTTAIVNASIMATSWGKGAKRFNKPIVVDIELPVQDGG